MNDAGGEITRPNLGEGSDLVGDRLRQALGDFVGAGADGFGDRRPAMRPECVLAANFVVAAEAVQLRQGCSGFAAMLRLGMNEGDSVEERHDGRGPAEKRGDGRAVFPLHRQRAGQAAGGKVLHQADEKGKIAARTRFS